MTIKQRRRVILLTAAALVTLPSAVLYTNYAISNQPEPEKQEEVIFTPRVTVIPTLASNYRSKVQALVK